MKKRVNLLILTSFLLILSLSNILALTAPNPGHTSNEIYIRINNLDKTLQDSINNGDFSTCVSGSGSNSQSIIFGHSADEIIVNVEGTTKTLQTAINDGSLTSASAGTSPSTYSEISFAQYETADKINITIKGSDKTLQQAINDGDFKCDAGPVLVNVNIESGFVPSSAYGSIKIDGQIIGWGSKSKMLTTGVNHTITMYLDRGHSHPTGGAAAKLTLTERTFGDGANILVSDTNWKSRSHIFGYDNAPYAQIYGSGTVAIEGTKTITNDADDRYTYVEYKFIIL